jgi:hypothetical protein
MCAPGVGGEPARGEPLEERAAGEHHQQEHGHQEARDGIADHQHARGPGIELLAVVHGLADAEGDRDEIGDERHPDAERDGDGKLLLDELHHADVAEVALAEIEQEIVLHHQDEALVRRLVEAELLLEALDEFLVEPLGAPILGAGVAAALAICACVDVGTARRPGRRRCGPWRTRPCR